MGGIIHLSEYRGGPIMPNETPIGRKLRQARLRKNMTMEALSVVSGISSSRISDIETGRTQHPRKGTLTALASALEISPLILLDDNLESPWMPFEVTGLDVPSDIKEWLLSHESNAWIELAREASASQISPDVVHDIIRALRKAKEAEERNVEKDTNKS